MSAAGRSSAQKWVLEILMILVALAWIYPALFVLNNAIKPEAEIKLHPISLPTTLTAANFAKAWVEMRFPYALLNTAIITAFGVAGIILVSSMAAWKLARTFGRLSWVAFRISSVITSSSFGVRLVNCPSELQVSIWSCHTVGSIVPYPASFVLASKQ